MLGTILTVFCALFFVGIINRTKSIFSGRKGPGILQPLKDIYVLLRKGSVFSTSTSFVFQIASSITLASIICAMFLLPFVNEKAIISFKGDFLLFAYLLAVGKFFQIISALDVGSGFEGMGANREALYSMLLEPAFFILLASVAMLTGYTSFYEIFSHLQFTENYSYIIGILVVYVFVQIAMVENSRLPVDDPKTHLELTMVHEVMVLDNSGFDMALAHIGTSLKFVIYGNIIANCLISTQLEWFYQIGLFLAIQFGFAVCVGYLESFRARNKMMRNPQFLLTLTSISLIIFFIGLIITSKLVVNQ